MHGARNYFSYLLCLSSSCLCKDLHRSRSSPRPSISRPPPANQWPDDADAYWAQKNLPLVLAILCLYRYTLAALTTAKTRSRAMPLD